MDYRGQQTHKTQYHGVWLLEQDGDWWIQTDSGCDDYIGRNKPDDATIRVYVEMYK